MEYHEVPTHIDVEETVAISEEVRLPRKVVVFALITGGTMIFWVSQLGLSLETALYLWVAATGAFTFYATFRRQKLNLLQWVFVLLAFYTRPRVLIWLRERKEESKKRKL